MTYRILTLNNISPSGLARLPRERYEIGAELAAPDAILVRSADMHGLEVAPDACCAIGRAGAGINNIPVAEMSKRGIPVFNAPGANANAVKELVLAGLFLAARNIARRGLFARGLSGDDEAIDEAVGSRQEAVRRLRAARTHARRRRARRHRRRGRQLRAGARHEGARLRPADHRAARLAAVLERGAGAVAGRPVRARRRDQRARAAQRRTPADW